MTASHSEAPGGDSGSPQQPDPGRTDGYSDLEDPGAAADSVNDSVLDSAGNPRTAARALAAGLEPDTLDYSALRRLLAKDLGPVLAYLSDEIADVADEAIARFHAVALDGHVEESTALAYLRRMARNEAVDRLRRSRSDPRGQSIVENTGMDDDAIARLIDRRAGAQQLEAALAHAVAVGDHTCVQVAAAFMYIVESGSKPSLAATARELKLTAPGVRKALDRLENYISAVCGDS